MLSPKGRSGRQLGSLLRTKATVEQLGSLLRTKTTVEPKPEDQRSRYSFMQRRRSSAGQVPLNSTVGIL